MILRDINEALWSGLQETKEVDEIMRGEVNPPGDSRIWTMPAAGQLEFDFQYPTGNYHVVLKDRRKIEVRDLDAGFLVFRADVSMKFKLNGIDTIESIDTRRASGDKYKGLPGALYEHIVNEYGWIIMSGYAHSTGSVKAYIGYAQRKNVDVWIAEDLQRRGNDVFKLVGKYGGSKSEQKLVYPKSDALSTRLILTRPGEFRKGQILKVEMQ